MNPFTLTLVFVDPKMEKNVKQALFAANVRGATWVYGRGTVGGKYLSLLGLDSVKKAVCLMVHRTIRREEIANLIGNRCQMHKHGRGICLALPVQEVYGIVNKEDATRDTITYKGEHTMNDQMIVVIVEKNRGDDVVEAAKRGGARGATILHGRGSGAEKIEHFVHLEIEPEKEIVLVAAQNGQADAIIQSIRQDFDFDKPNTGILFTLALSGVLGMNR